MKPISYQPKHWIFMKIYQNYISEFNWFYEGDLTYLYRFGQEIRYNSEDESYRFNRRRQKKLSKEQIKYIKTIFFIYRN